MKRSRIFHERASRRRKALGQHFLANLRAADAIVAGFAPRPGEPVLEVGPGHGVMTERLLARGAVVVAVEKDPALVAELRRRFAAESLLDLHEADALRVDFEAILRPALAAAGRPRARVLANLPYSVATKILARWLAAADLFESFTLLLQREVVERIAARPGGKAYGSLSVLAQYFTRPEIKMHLAPGSFRPPPKVDSSLVHMVLRQERELSREQEAAYPAFARRLFLSRRRTLPHNLKGIWGAETDRIARGLAEMGIDPERRPETLTREECVAIFRASPARQEEPDGGR